MAKTPVRRRASTGARQRSGSAEAAAAAAVILPEGPSQEELDALRDETRKAAFDHDKRLQRIEDKLHADSNARMVERTQVDKRQDEIRAGQDRIIAKLDDAASETRKRFDEMNGRINSVETGLTAKITAAETTMSSKLQSAETVWERALNAKTEEIKAWAMGRFLGIDLAKAYAWGPSIIGGSLVAGAVTAFFSWLRH